MGNQPAVRPAGPYAWRDMGQWWYDTGHSIERADTRGEAWLCAMVPHVERMVRYHLAGYDDIVITEAISHVHEQLWRTCERLPADDRNIRSYLLSFISWRAKDSRDATIRRREISLDTPLRDSVINTSGAELTLLSDRVAAPLNEVSQLLMNIDITALLASLPEDGQIREIAACLCEGLSLRETGRELGIPAGTMHRRIHERLAPLVIQFYTT